MAINRSVERSSASVAEAQLARVAGDGCARHPYLAMHCWRLPDRTSGRDLADAVHLLCSLHGRYPGLIELALADCVRRDPPRTGSSRASRSVRARAALPRPGDLRRRPAAKHAGRRRDRIEPVRGAPRARNARAIPNARAARWARRPRWSATGGRSAGCSTAPRPAPGLECPAPSLPDEASVVGVIGGACDDSASDRALAFGGEQLLLQHRALFDLLEARAEARGDY